MSDAVCARCASPIELGDLRCAVCALLVAQLETVDKSAPERARIVRCTDCGAAMAFSAEAQAPRCAFCGATTKIEEPLDPIERAEALLPFTVERDAAAAALKAWLGKRGWFAPNDLVGASAIEKLEPLYWAGWVVDARAHVTWAADSDLGSQSSAWAPHSGGCAMDFAGMVVRASRGLSADECHALIPRYDLGSVRAITDDDAKNVEAFDAQRSVARKHVLAGLEATAAARLQEGTIPGRRFRKVKVGILLEGLKTRRLAFPAWVLAYRYKGTPYRAIVHGQDAARVEGSAPTSTAKVAIVMAIVIALICGIILLATR